MLWSNTMLIAIVFFGFAADVRELRQRLCSSWPGLGVEMAGC